MIDFRPIDPSAKGLEEVQWLLNERFPKAKHLDQRYLDWAYYQNPLGPAVTANAYADSRLVGHNAAQPIRARLNGQDELGLLGIHGAVRVSVASVSKPDFPGRARPRRVSVLDTLLDQIIAEGTEAGYGFFILFTNAASTRIVKRRQDDFQIVAPLDAKVGIGPIPPGGSRAKTQFARTWDAQTLDWRLARPGARYRQRSRAGRCTLYAATHIPGLAVKLGRFPHSDISVPLPRISPLTPLRLWLGLDAGRDWSRYAYVDLPERLRPSPLNLVFKDLTDRGRRLDARRACVDAIDLDAF